MYRIAQNGVREKLWQIICFRVLASKMLAGKFKLLISEIWLGKILANCAIRYLKSYHGFPRS